MIPMVLFHHFQHQKFQHDTRWLLPSFNIIHGALPPFQHCILAGVFTRCFNMNTGSTLINVSTTYESGIDWDWSPVAKNTAFLFLLSFVSKRLVLWLYNLTLFYELRDFNTYPHPNLMWFTMNWLRIVWCSRSLCSTREMEYQPALILLSTSYIELTTDKHSN